MGKAKFADIHSHCTLYGFNRMRNTEGYEDDPARYHPWFEMPSRVDHAAKGKQAARYSQGNFARLVEGDVELVFLSFTPIEKGFFIGSAHGEDRPFWRELFRWVRGEVPLSAFRQAIDGDVDGAVEELLGVIRNRGPLRQLIQQLVMDYSPERVSFLASESYDYWEELLEEYDFTRKCDGEVARVEIDTAGGSRSVEGSYKLVRNVDDLEAALDTPHQVATVLTIEGAHVFSMGPDLKPVSRQAMARRIDELKSWEHPILFLTLAHHFDNGLCGHAHSIMDAANWIMDQRHRLNEGFDEDRGLFVVRELLDLDAQLRDRGGRRIIIDVRHMSARSRKTYYDEIVRPYNDRWGTQPEEDRPKIPVVMSHGAYSGISSLEEMIDRADREGDHWHRGPFYAWNINASDEDVRVIHESGGLLGLIFDRRILGVGPNEEVPDEFWPDVVLRQIFAVVDVIMLDDRLEQEQKRSIWDCICLGTDFDGFIHPVECYPTALELGSFREDLRRRLLEKRHTRMIDEIGVDRLVDKICFDNATNFAKKHLPAAAGVH